MCVCLWGGGGGESPYSCILYVGNFASLIGLDSIEIYLRTPS